MPTTSRLSLRYPSTSDSADVPRDIGNLASDIDSAAIFSKGTFASRPTSTVGSPGIDGRYYFATDTSRLYLDTGTSWVEVASGDGSVSTAMLAAASVTAPKLAAGSIVQVVEGSTTSTVTIATTTFTDSGLSASITPSSSSNKILVLISQSSYIERAASDYFEAPIARILRGATQLYSQDNLLGIQAAVGTRTDLMAVGGNAIMTYLDSPATTSSTTYKVQMKAPTTSASCAVYAQVFGTERSTMTLMEVRA